MSLPEIQATVIALRNTRGLPWPAGHKKKLDEDMLDWLQTMFGFQKDNVSNQREHLILLLANVHIRQFPRPEQQPKVADYSARGSAAETAVHGTLSFNMGRGCKPEIHARMPLLYIYHHMAFELYEMLAGSISPMTGEHVKPTYGGEDEAFLQKVVTPILSDTVSRILPPQPTTG
ncbi:unnamed protein product [Arabis nemorensis]|uniref:1,3-beta-glucan synthase component FKS1-like domain-containing protein n=1 Tax=Arabis nemorensis TaxID=586526 RepID=A0A565AN34_9BRAS|nr:unnamed protein product [Arabis nemorensis]